MTPTNTQIMQALFSRLTEAELDPPIAWPGVDFDPPATGIWLEVVYQPNQGIDNGLSASDAVVPQGLMTVMVMDRPGRGVFAAQAVAEQVMAVYPKNHKLVGLVRIQRTPYVFELPQKDDRLGWAVSVDYSG